MYKRQVHYDPKTYDGLPYLVQNDTLFVTYDEGETYLEVPDGYDKVCLQSNGTHLERLHTNGYIVTPELTAFLTYSDEVRPNATYGSSEDYDYGSYSGMETACLYYSLDEGQSLSLIHICMPLGNGISLQREGDIQREAEGVDRQRVSTCLLYTSEPLTSCLQGRRSPS